MPLTQKLGTPNSLLGFSQVLGPVVSAPSPGTLPTEPPFDIYCVAVGAPLLTYTEVSTIGNGCLLYTSRCV